MQRTEYLLKLSAYLILALCLITIGYGQETTGAVRGNVTDPSGAAIPGAKVELSSAAIPQPFTTVTNAAGQFVFAQVPPGTGYSVSITAQGFRNSKASNLAVSLGKATQIDIKMEVGQVSESVVVSAESTLVDTQSSASAVTVDKSFFDLIPKGRSFYDLIAIAPGARNEGKAGGFQVDGASGSENTYYLDGMEVTNIQTGILNARNQIPNEMVQQVQIKNGVMEAQYGGAMGGVVNAVVRSGSNEFHGQGGFYFNNNAMEARDRATIRLDPWNENRMESFANPKDSFSTWNPVFSIGGPLVKNRLFFFAGFMPTFTDTTRTVRFNQSQPYTYKSGTYNSHFFQHYTTGKVDYVPLSKLRVNVAWIYNPNYTRGVLPAKGGTDAMDTPWGANGGYTAGQMVSGEVNYLATSKLVLSFRGGYNFTNYTNNYGLPSYTAIYYSGQSTALPPAALQGPNGWRQGPTAFTQFDIYTRKNYNADASYMLNFFGQHTLKGGWQTNQLANSVATSSYANGYYRYYWGLSYTCVTAQCSGKQTGPLGYYRYRQLGTYGDASSENQGIFIQDSWKVNKRLTLSLGLRSEREFLPSFQYGDTKAAPPIEFSWGEKISPRLGFALDPTGSGKQRIYASWGYFYDVMKYEMPRGSFGGDVWLEWYYSLDNANVVTQNTGVPADPMKMPGKFFEKVNWRIPSNDPAAGLIDPNLKPMKQRMFDFGYDFTISPTLVASTRYTNRRLIRTIEDIGYIGADGETYLIGNPGYGVVADAANWKKWMGAGIPTTPKAERKYDAVEFRVDKRFSRSYQFTASYTWSRLYGNYSGLASSDEDGRNSPNVNRYFDQPWVYYTQNGKFAEGNLGTDRPHTFKFFGSYNLRSKLGTTTFAPNVALYSGTPITTEVPVVSSTPMAPFGRGDLGRTPFFKNFDFNVMHDFLPWKSKESVKLRLEFTVFNLFNNGTPTNMFKTIMHSSDGYLQFDDYASIFKGFDTLSLMKVQGDRIDPQYKAYTAWQAPRSTRLQISLFF